MTGWVRMDAFCGSKFWDDNVTWTTDDPDFTPCFQRTALIWLPCAFLWVFSPIEAVYLVYSQSRNVPWNGLNLSKLGLISLLFILSLVDLGHAITLASNEDEIVFNVQYYTPAILIISLGLSGVLLIFNRMRGMTSSGLLFYFWLLMALSGAVQFRSEIRRSMDHSNHIQSYNFISYMIYYPLVVMQFILHCFADKPPLVSPPAPDKTPCPELLASTLSRQLFSWFDGIASLGYRRPLEPSDLWSLDPQETSLNLTAKFNKYWNKPVPSNQKQGKPSILGPLFWAFGPNFLFYSLFKLMDDCLTFVNPYIFGLLIGFTQSQEPQWKGYMYVGLMLTAASVKTIVLSQYFYKTMYVSIRVRTALISSIYRKSLRMSNAARKKTTVGEIVNLMSVDAERFVEATAFINMIWAAPLHIALALYFLWGLLGPSVLVGVAIMIILIPVNGVIANKIKTLQIKQMKTKDERVKIINEVLSGIKVLKLYAWEPAFEENILKIRAKEMQVLKKDAYLNATTTFIGSCAPVLVGLVTLASYVLSGNDLTAATAFVSLAYFQILRMPMMILPLTTSVLIQTSVSVKRINKFLNCDEIDPDDVTHANGNEHIISIEDGSFSWGPREAAFLKNINLQLKPGQLAAVVGSVGSGKSSLISALLGEMNKISGRVNVNGSVAYVSQQAWIQNATLRENILFGNGLQEKVYDRVVAACALEQDFEMLPGGDATEIGEKGINLSGGQKQRLSLARAAYANSDIYFLDDPLSAVDSHVGKHIFNNLIGPSGILKEKTRLLVTHSTTYLSQVDVIIVLTNGMLSEIGTYKELLERKGAFAEFLISHLGENDVENSEKASVELQRQTSESNSGPEKSQEKKHGLDVDNSLKPTKDKLIEIETAETGSVKWRVYSHYLLSIGVWLSVGALTMNVVYQSFSIGANVWLSEWSDASSSAVNGSLSSQDRDMYLGIYGAFGFGQVITTFLASLSLYMGAVKAAAIMHTLMLRNVLRSPNSFFEVTPLGRILHRFSKEIQTLDKILPTVLTSWCSCFFSVVATIVVISYTTPIFITVVLPIGAMFYFLQRYYIATSRQLQRIESVSRSPIYSHFGESLSGAQTIRAFNVKNEFIRESDEKVDFNQVCYYPRVIARRWLSIRLELISNLVIFFAALFAVFYRDTMNPGLVGLSISYALQVTGTLNWLVRMSSDVETNIVAVERIKEYSETPQEAPWINPATKPAANWPTKGEVEFRNYQARYRDGLDLVLKGINLFVKGGEKVGIVGRTAAGKSTLTLALLRIIEPAAGAIFIDDIDVSKIGLHDLRTRLTIIPQEPVLFSGTIRLNLDPSRAHTDQEIWQALHLAHFKPFVSQLALGLEHEVSEGGANLSVGQKQLICLARALLRKTKLLILDEATAAVDLETDDMIQRTIRSEFKECTVFTIAHRLNTILDSDRVVVMDKGLIVEQGNPQALLNDPKSLFAGMAKDAGITADKNK